MSNIQIPAPLPTDRTRLFRWMGLSLVGAFVCFLIILILTGKTWIAFAFALVALFGLLFALAFYFWGTMIFGGILEAVGRRQTPVPWSMENFSPGDVPEHDLDPGLELLAAGLLVYRLGEVKPRAYFRQVPLTNIRAVRPFVVARTGSARPYQFEFVLSSESDTQRIDDELVHHLTNAPQVVMPLYRLVLSQPRKLADHRWTLQVRAGVTVVTSLRFVFVDDIDPASAQQHDRTGDDSEPALAWQQQWLPRLLDEAAKQDVMSNPREMVLEDL
jgi:hypothetical protein